VYKYSILLRKHWPPFCFFRSAAGYDRSMAFFM